MSRDTVVRYITGAQALGVSREGGELSEEQLSRLAAIGQPGPRRVETPSEDLLSPWADQIHRWLTGDRLQLTRIQELLTERGCRVSYASLQRFVARRNWRRRSKATVRMEDTSPGEVAVMAELKLLHPEWEPVPYQVKRTAVRDACRAMSNLKKANKELARAKAKGERLDEDFAELHFRSRKNPRQSCYIRNPGW